MKAVDILQRVLLPRKGEPHDVRMLYLIEAEQNKQRLSWPNRHQVMVPEGAEVSFETYFNAFPAAYWRRWSQLDEVILSLEITGTATISVYRSKEDGTRISVTNVDVASGDVAGGDVAGSVGAGDNTVDGAKSVEIPLALKNFEDGGWLWFDITAESDVTVNRAAWCAGVEPEAQIMPDGSTVGPFAKEVAVGIPTFNRPRDAVNALHALAEDPEVLEAITQVIMPDQGNQHPADEPDFEEAQAALGDRLQIYPQGNLGGSGGYSRIMYEARNAPYILYMDDDIAIEPDSILRVVQAARYAKSPILVGGQMLNLQDRSQLRTTGEAVNHHDFMWGAAPHAVYDHDFAKYPLGFIGTPEQQRDPHFKDSRALHRRVDVDYNGWWMNLFPRVVAEQLGLPLPLFIKWDDTEYALRAKAAGFPTVTWPGAAIWHMAWADKDDAIDWQAYFHLRNRLIVAAMYHEGDFTGIQRSILKSSMKHLMCMEYSTMAIQIEALKDVLAGPDQLFEILESSLPRIQKVRQRYDDAKIIESAAQLPSPTGAPGVPTRNIGGRLGKVKKIPWLLKTLKHLGSQEDRSNWEAPQLNLTAEEARWFTLSRVDSATVSTAGGTGVAFRKRDKKLADNLIKQTRALLSEINTNWEDLKQQYRVAQPELVARKNWKKIFDEQA